MNIFYLHQDPNTSAQAMTNKHVVKMILESAQMLSTAHHILDGENAPKELYKKTHHNHPSAVWARKNNKTYQWLYEHFKHLSQEYTNRYKRTHESFRKLNNILKHPPKNIPQGNFTQPPQAMPDIYKDTDSVQAYRKYYETEKIKEDNDLLRYKTILWGTI